MNCPHCSDTVLTMSHRNGIEIDFCPKCRGIWLDRGELDKIVERSDGERDEWSDRSKRSERSSDESGRYNSESSRHRSYQGRRRSWLSELFD